MNKSKIVWISLVFLGLTFNVLSARGETTSNSPPNREQKWNWHIQNTNVFQGHPGFTAKYSGQNSLSNHGEVKETVNLDLFAGLRLWPGAEAHVDGLMWQGFGLSQTLGIEAFPNANAYKFGTQTPDYQVSRLFIRQTFGLGGDQETVPDTQLTLAGKQDVSRLTFTIGRFSLLDIFDHNIYAQNGSTQFMNWSLVGNLAWDYPADSVGYTTGFALEFTQPQWTVRYGFFQMPRVANGFTAEDTFLQLPSMGADGPFLQSWGMPLEYERRYSLNAHPGAIRILAWLNEANMANLNEAAHILQTQGAGADISPSQAYRLKYGFGLNIEQQITKNIGIFSRLGWNDGHESAWTYTDANWTASLGVSLNGTMWSRLEDTAGMAVIVSGASSANQAFLGAGGMGILAGDGALNYSPEEALEIYYDAAVLKTIHLAVDYQFLNNPAFNYDRGPVSIFGVRLHWEL